MKTHVVGMSLLALACAAGTASASVVYDFSTETGSRSTPGGGTIFFDDAFISNTLVGTNTAITLDAVTVGIRRVAGAGAVDITVWAAPMIGTSYGVGGILGTPVALGTVSLLGPVAASTTQLVTVNSTVTIDLNSAIVGAAPNFSGLFIGVSFSNADALNGWRLTSGGPAGANFTDRFVSYNTGTAVASVVGFAAPTLSTFYTRIDGTLVPTPGAIALLGAGGLLAARRRR